jgi:UDP-N-acetylmuramyl pentapeptide phosphotransferase/UDP-N-acetylglucosamine-1-phosphate transferase
MRWGRFATTNHRGVPVPMLLGIALALCATASTVVYAAVRDPGAAAWGALAGMLLVFAAGFVDDLAPVGPRGLRNHLRELVSGRMTTGILKLIVTVGASVFAVALQPERAGYARAAAVVLVAASANVWNGLDVRPGRALKAFVVVCVAFAIWGDLANVPAMAGLAAGAIVALPFDLTERAMLGDGGANLLGFAVGLAVADVLADPWVPAAAVAAVGLNVLADTVTFSRVIDATPPLRWADGLGRRP